MDQHAKHGFRNNLALEGSTFSADGHSIWTATEASLIQDGKSPTPTTEDYLASHNMIDKDAY